VQTERDMPLIDFLRDELRLTSVKKLRRRRLRHLYRAGDGRKQRACVYTTGKAGERPS
jgi:aerobic-type carbon monoxide dehydrogenase small subunit (CoxS/CutS family)